MKILFFGTGSIGRRHIKNLKLIYGESCSIIALKSNVYNDTPSTFLDEFDVNIFRDELDAFKQKPDIVFVTNPTFLHLETIKKAINNNCHVFVEKPIAMSTEYLNELEKSAKKKGLIIFVGYCLRYHPIIKDCKTLVERHEIGKIYKVFISFNGYLPKLHPWREYNDVYRSKKNSGGDVALEFSHEIDYMLWLFGEPQEIFGIIGKTGKFNLDIDDYFCVITKLEKEIVVQINLNYLSHISERTCHIIGQNGVIKFDLINNSMQYHAENNEDSHLYSYEKLNINDIYIDEIKDFMDAINNNIPSPININDGRNVLKFIELSNLSNINNEKVYWN